MVRSIDEARRSQQQGSGRVPPHNLQAEESLLGAMLLSKDALAVGAEMLSADEFYKPAHGHVFASLVHLFAQGEPADPVTVADELRRQGLLDAIGGPAVLISLQANTPATSNASRYATIIEEHALLRRLIGAAGEIAEMSYSVPEDVPETLDRAESLVFDVVERRRIDSLVDLDTATSRGLDALEARYANPDGAAGITTGFLDLDELLLGMQPSELYVAAGRPGHGKTSFALGIARHVGVELQRPVVIFSLEMSTQLLWERLVAAEAKVDSRRLRSGRLLEADWPRLSHGIERLAGAPIVIDDNAYASVLDMRSRCRRLRARFGDLGLIVVDYLQLMESGGRPESRQVEVAQMSRGLKLMARDLEAPVLALSQLSRNLEYRQDKRPVLADLRDSGAIEQDSDVVMLLYRDELYFPESADRGVAEVHVAKNRSGPLGTSRLAYLDQYAKFANMARV